MPGAVSKECEAAVGVGPDDDPKNRENCQDDPAGRFQAKTLCWYFKKPLVSFKAFYRLQAGCFCKTRALGYRYELLFLEEDSPIR